MSLPLCPLTVSYCRYNFHPSREPEPIGDVNLPLKGLNIGDKKAMSMQLIDPSGKKLRATVRTEHRY
jgi:hypothetical protein